MATKKIKTYPMKRPDGTTVRVTVPENDESELFDHIREQLSPEAVAAIAAWLQPATTNNSSVNRQITWFRDQLVEMLGVHEYNRLIEAVGL